MTINFTLQVVRNLLYLIICYALGLSSCGPNDEVKPTYYIDQDTKDFCIFNVGSWWVYQDSASGQRDTVTILANSNILFTIELASFIGEIHTDTLLSTFKQKKFKYKTFTSSVNRGMNWTTAGEDIQVGLNNYQDVTYGSKTS